MTLVLLHLDAAASSMSLFADSRVASPALPEAWDSASKIFPLQPTPHFAAYCGASVAALSAFAQASIAVKYSRNLATARVETIGAVLKQYIEAARCPWTMPFQFIVVGDALAPRAGFRWEFRAYQVVDNGSIERFDPRQIAPGVYAMGSGAVAAEQLLQGNRAPSARDVFGALKAVIEDENHPTIGGPPQMVVSSPDYSAPVGFVWTVPGGVVNSLLGVTILHQPAPPGPDGGAIRFLDEDFHPAEFVGRGMPPRQVGGSASAIVDKIRRSGIAGASTEEVVSALQVAIRPSESSPQAFLYVQIDHEAQVPQKICHVRPGKLFAQILALLGATGGLVGTLLGTFPALGILAGCGLLAVLYGIGGSVSVPTVAQSMLIFILCSSIKHAMMRDEAARQFSELCEAREDVRPDDFAAALQGLEDEHIVAIEADGSIRLVQEFTATLR